VSNFLTAHQHILGYSVPENGVKDAIKEKHNQGYLAMIKYEKQVASLNSILRFSWLSLSYSVA